jgi:hypothetical protein
MLGKMGKNIVENRAMEREVATVTGAIPNPKKIISACLFQCDSKCPQPTTSYYRAALKSNSS